MSKKKKKQEKKTQRPKVRLPMSVVRKLRSGKGCGAHSGKKGKKGYNRKKEKKRGRN